MSTMQRRRQLVKATKKYGLHVQPAALQAMLRYCGGAPDGKDETNDPDLEYLRPILEQLQDRLARVNPKIITLPLWEEAVEEATAKAVALSEKAAAAATVKTNTQTVAVRHAHKVEVGSSKRFSAPASYTIKSKHPDWRIVDAFETPTLLYDSLRQQLHYDVNAGGQQRPSLFGGVEDKLDMMSQRFWRAQQRVVRSVPQLTSIDRLLGTSSATSSSSQMVLLLGLLQATSTSRAMAQAQGDGAAGAATGFALEDLTGSIPLQLHSDTHVDDSGVYTDGCIVLVQGYYDDGIFVVSRLQLPPIESKAKSQPYLPPPPANAPMVTSHIAMLSPLTLYTMANVALDDPAVLQQLEDLITHLASDEHIKSQQVVLVLMGNFATKTISLSVALEELSRILEPLPSNHSVVILPGPNDAPSMCWPIPPIKAPPAFSNHLQARVEFASNPCRLQYGNQQDVLLFRQDMIRQHLKHEILSARTSSSSSSPLTGERRRDKERQQQAIGNRILHTVLSQGHLLPQAPIYWNYDYALSVYPLPDLMLVGLEEGETKVRSFQEADCHVLAPGSNGNWAKVTLQPRHRRRAGASKLPLQVEFSQPAEEEEEDDSGMSGAVSDEDSMDED